MQNCRSLGAFKLREKGIEPQELQHLGTGKAVEFSEGIRLDGSYISIHFRMFIPMIQFLIFECDVATVDMRNRIFQIFLYSRGGLRISAAFYKVG